MAQRTVTKAFKLNLADGSVRAFEPGEPVDAELAEHWYVQAHSQPAEDAPPAGDPAA